MGYEFSCSQPNPPSVPSTHSEGETDSAMQEAAERKERLAARLVEAIPSFEIFNFQFDAIATSLGISIEEARHRWRHIELNCPEDEGHGIQVTLHDDHAFINVAYWHQGAEAESTIQTLWKCLKLIREEGNMPLVTDHQRHCRIDLENDFDSVLTTYLRGVRLNTAED